MARVDRFIYLDNVQFKKRYFENRNKIRANNIEGFEWITVPVITKGRYTQKINEVKIDYTQNWQRKYLNKIKQAYCKAPFFGDIFIRIEEILHKNYEGLIDLNLLLIDFIRDYLGIVTPVMLASNICDTRGSDLILGICIKLNADIYISGPDGRNYLELNKFSKNKINVEYHNYTHPIYRQLYEPFISHMSITDLLFNYGKDSIAIIK
jgi:hypothetical protein